jgi:ribosomal 50S subunit-associated protein YjgA (DUF615 family)
MPLSSTEDLQAELAELRKRVDAYLGVDALGSLIEQATKLKENWTRDEHLKLLGRLKFDEMQHQQVKKRLQHLENELRGRGIEV